VDPTEPESIADGLRRVLSDPALAASLGEPLPAGVHAASTRSMAVETALQRKIFRIQ